MERERGGEGDREGEREREGGSGLERYDALPDMMR